MRFFFNYFFKLHIKISLNYHHRILQRFLIWKKKTTDKIIFFRHLTISRMVSIYLFIESIIVDSRAIKRHDVKKGCLIFSRDIRHAHPLTYIFLSPCSSSFSSSSFISLSKFSSILSMVKLGVDIRRATCSTALNVKIKETI